MTLRDEKKLKHKHSVKLCPVCTPQHGKVNSVNASTTT
jgi:hypothetical protein